MQASSSPTQRAIAAALWLWLAAAVIAALAVPAPLASPALRVALIFGPVLAFAIAIWARRSVFDAIDAVSSRTLVALHVIRLVVGIAFLFLAPAGLLPREFAMHAGLGDIIAGAGALAIAIAWPWLARERGRLVSVLALWNAFGILDFLNVQRVVYLLRDRGDEFIALNRLPLSLIPYVVVTALFATHVFLVTKLVRTRGSALLAS